MFEVYVHSANTLVFLIGQSRYCRFVVSFTFQGDSVDHFIHIKKKCHWGDKFSILRYIHWHESLQNYIHYGASIHIDIYEYILPSAMDTHIYTCGVYTYLTLSR